MKTNQEIIEEQKAWIASGKIGCVFASALVKQAEKIGWKFVTAEYAIFPIEHLYEDIFILSILFPGKTIDEVRTWALLHSFYIEPVDMYEGLRIKMKEGISWVQYFGPDSHVKTRQTPYPMLSFTVRLPAHVYAKTMAVGILHLAHASIENLSAKKCKTLWEQSYAATKKILGRSPNKSEAAKVTFLK